MKQNISRQISLIGASIDWAAHYGKGSFPVDELKEYRRRLKRIRFALEENCSVAAYGESQVGKSYLMSSLLSTPSAPFVITNKGRSYSFVDDLNPSGGNTSQLESTGVITRFTIKNDNPEMKDYVKVRNLSVADLVMLLADSYYNDLKINPETAMSSEEINQALDKLNLLGRAGKTAQDDLTEDDVKDIFDYIREVLGASALNVVKSDFGRVVPKLIKHIGADDWVNVFSLLWNNNAELSRLFTTLIQEYRQLGFKTEVYVPFEAVIRKKGTLLKIQWLDSICGIQQETKDELQTDVFDSKGNLLASAFSKASLSALIAELTFVLPPSIADERKFLHKLDLLDFPGARSREKFEEQEIGKVLPTILRRGKVAYLFRKYSRTLRISSVLFCHHNNQKTEPSLGESIHHWIKENIGVNPAERADNLKGTNGISPLFFIATKFNIELSRTKTDLPSDTSTLDDHWKRFTEIFPKIIEPAEWFDRWVTKGGGYTSEAFQSVYPLRDFYWSRKGEVFDGYEDGEHPSPELRLHHHQDYPAFYTDLRLSFLKNKFVSTHFADPERTWEEVATLNNDGSKAIIRDLDEISGVLDSARRRKYLKELKALREEILNKLRPHYEPEDKEQNSQRIRAITGDIRRSLDSSIGRRPDTFGRIIDRLMIPVGDLRKIAYDIVILKTETPKDFDEIMLIRIAAGIKSSDDRETKLRKLLDYNVCGQKELEEEYTQRGFTVEDVISNESSVPTTVAELVSNKILNRWGEFINSRVAELNKYLPHSDEVAFMLQTLCQRLGVNRVISTKIDSYSHVFPSNDLPNAIADFASLTLNNFVSTVGREYMSKDDLENIREKADACNLSLDFSPATSDVKGHNFDLIEVLKAFDEATDTANVSVSTLMKLPFWDNFQRWKNLLVIGLLYASDVAHCDPEANAAIKRIIDDCQTLYQAC